MLFSDIIGQENVKDRLIQNVKNDRISHAQLFLGPEGSGNLALAIAYAQFISCSDRTPNDSCGHCPACVKFNKLVHPDLHFSYPVATTKGIDKPVSLEYITSWRKEVLNNPYMSVRDWYEAIGLENKQGFIGVEEAADVMRRLSLKTFEAEYKFMLIWMPEKMRVDAANKLLKILEEPTGQTLFLLIANDSEEIITTILSRTQLLKINKLRDSEMLDALQKNHGFQGSEAKELVHLADGNYNRLLELLGQEEEQAGKVDTFLAWMRLCYSADVAGIMQWVEATAKLGRENQKNFLAYSIHMGRESLMINYGSKELIRLDGEELQSLSKFAPFINEESAPGIIEELDKAYYHIERNVNAKMVFTDLSFKLHFLLKKKPKISA